MRKAIECEVRILPELKKEIKLEKQRAAKAAVAIDNERHAAAVTEQK